MQLRAPEGYFERQLHRGHTQGIPAIPCLNVNGQLDTQ